MKRRGILWLSLALNVALATTVFLSAKTPAPGQITTDSQSLSSTNPPSQPSTVNSTLAGLPFLWSQIASEDLKIYRDNLRAIGCPELKVREIIRAEINERFGVRRRSILASFQDRYWDLIIRRELAQRQRIPQTEWGQALESLKAERQQQITEVLGRDALVTEIEQQTQRTKLEQQRSWLPPEKRDRLIELEEKYQERLAEWAETLASRVNGVPTPEDQDRLQKCQQEFDESEKQLLTPAELTELHLRESNVTDWAGNLPGFDPSEDEWRTMTKLRSELDENQNQFSSQDLTDEERSARQNELQADFDNAIKGVLDPDRFKQYQLANNSQFQALQNVTQRYGLPDSVAVQSLGVQQTAQTAAEQVRANPDLSPEAQQAALNAIQQETERTLGQTLGPKVLSTYKEYSGDWITKLGQPNQE